MNTSKQRKRTLHRSLLVFTSLVLTLSSTTALANPLGDRTWQTEMQNHSAKKVELLNERTSKSQTFANPDGTFTTTMYPTDKFYKDDTGTWKSLDTTFVSNGKGGYKNTSGLVNFDFPSTLDNAQAFTLSSPHKPSVTMKMTDATGKQAATTKGGKILYSEVKSGMDVSYEAQANHVKESMILKNANASNTIHFALHAPGLTFKQAKDGSIEGNDSKGKAVYEIPAPFMDDDNGVRSNAVTTALTSDTNGDTLLTLTADENWLKDPHRKFPVVVDPTVGLAPDVYTGRDTSISSNNTSASYYTDPHVFVGNGGTGMGTVRGLITFDNLPNLLIGASGATITNATLSMYQDSTSTNGLGVAVYPITNTWTTTGVNWSNQPSMSSTALDTQTQAASNISPNSPYVGVWNFNVTSNIQSVYKAQKKNYGFKLQTPNESTATTEATFASSDNSTEAIPALSITYTVKPIGSDKAWMQSSDGVNYANGNLSSHVTDLTGTGVGPTIAVTRTFNSQNLGVNEGFGSGWSSNLLMHLTVNLPGPILFTDAYGLVHVLVPVENNSGTWVDSASENEYLNQNSDGTFTLSGSGGASLQFDSTGKMTSVQSPAQSGKTQTLKLAYNSSGQLATLTDTTGRVWNVTYNSAGLISKITDPASRSASYSYDSTNTYLTTMNMSSTSDSTVTTKTYQNNTTAPQFVVANTAGNQIKYSWDANGAITSVASTVEGTQNTTNYVWGTVSSGSNAGDTEVTVTGSSNHSTEYVTNTNGNVVQTIVNPGGSSTHTTNYTWDQNDDIIQVQDPNGNTVSNAYNSNGDLVQFTDGNGANSFFSYDNLNNPKGSNTPNGATNHTVYNGAIPTDGIDNAGNESIATYDSNGNQTTSVDSIGLGNNLIPNSNFAFANSSNVPIDWTDASSGVSIDTTAADAAVGSTSLKINATSAAHDKMSVMIPVTPNQTYNLSGYIKTSNVTANTSGYGAGITAHWLNTSKVTNASEDLVGMMNTTDSNGWARKYASMTAPSDAAYLQLETDLYGSGTAWFGGLQLESAIATTPNLLLNSDYMDNATSDSTLPDNWTTTGFTSGDQIDTTNTNNGLPSLLVNGNSSTKSFSQTVNGPQYPVGGFQLSAWSKQSGATGSYVVTATITYSDQTTSTATATFSNTTSDWQHQNAFLAAKSSPSITGITVKANYSGQSGKAWFNDIELTGMPKTSSYSPYNIVQNPSFTSAYQNQSLSDDWTTLSTGSGTASLNTEESYGDANALQLHPGTTGTSAVKVANDGLAPYHSGATYTAVAHIHTEGLGADSAYVELQALDSNGNVLGSYDSDKIGNSSADFIGSIDWTAVIVTKNASSLPSGTANVRVVLCQDGDPNGGTAIGNSYFDDVRLVPFDLSTHLTYDTNGNYVTSVTDQLGNKTTYTPDANTGFVTSTTDALGNKSNFTGNKFNEITSTTLLASGANSGPTFTYGYDAEGNLTKVTDPNNTSYSYGYNELGLLKTFSETVNGTNQVTGYHHDAMGKMTEIDMPNTTTTTMSYNSFDQLSAINYYNSAGKQDGWNFSMDAVGNLQSMQNQSATSPTTFAYDSNNKLTSVSEPMSNGTNTQTMTLDPSGNVTKMAYAMAGGTNWSVNQTFDLLGRMNTVTDGSQTAYYTYDDHDNVVKTLDSSTGQAEFYTYGADQRVSHVTYRGGNGLDLSYQNDAVGRISKITNNTTGASVTYTYNSVGELTQETTWDGQTITYTYDNVGNRTSMAVTKNGTTTTTNYGYNTEKNRLVSITTGSTVQNVTFDANGQTLSDGTNTYTWSAANQLSSIKVQNGTTYSFTYDGLGRRVSAFGNTYHYNGISDQLAYLADTNNALVARFSYSATGQPMYMTVANGNSYRYVYDGQGNVTGLIDVTPNSATNGTQVVSYSYDAWGNLLSNTDTSGANIGSTNPFTYRGYMYDTKTGLYNLNARYYNPQLGRFISKDEVTPNTSSPLSANEYLYVGADPVNAIDPTGEDAVVLYNFDAAGGNGHIALGLFLPNGIHFVSFYLKSGTVRTGIFQGIYDGKNGSCTSPRSWGSLSAFAYWARFSGDGELYQKAPMFYIKGNSAAMSAKAYALEQNPPNYYVVGNSCLDVANEVLKAGGVDVTKYRPYKNPIPDDEMRKMAYYVQHGDPNLYVWNMWDYLHRKLQKTMPPQWAFWTM